MNLGIAGSRKYFDYSEFEQIVTNLINIQGWSVENIVSGGAQGTDKMAERYSKDHNINMVVLSPEWNKYGKSAGYITNKDIVKLSDVVIAFPAPDSKGTRHTISFAQQMNKPVHVFEIYIK